MKIFIKKISAEKLAYVHRQAKKEKSCSAATIKKASPKRAAVLQIAEAATTKHRDERTSGKGIFFALHAFAEGERNGHDHETCLPIRLTHAS
ncbi:hypothetical protein M655_013620 [Brevibacillus sp. NSP2.1]|uniref:hypothetical protein n=1 Tax=Brevibacillus sp. NSP2.1 TaxID=3003229 RepID=UPI000421EEF1|nr:hypothetical protein [Brevibacillus sp. NSP2.1]QHZ56605.1 hypothetical protein M655_013620 [Brevibacillus sp. NSP2.1]